MDIGIVLMTRALNHRLEILPFRLPTNKAVYSIKRSDTVGSCACKNRRIVLRRMIPAAREVRRFTYVRSKSSQLKRAKGGKRLNKRSNELLYTKEVSACGTVGYIRQKWGFRKHRLPSIIYRPTTSFMKISTMKHFISFQTRLAEETIDRQCHSLTMCYLPYYTQ